MKIEYVELLKGDLPKDKSNIFDGIDNLTCPSVRAGDRRLVVLLYELR